MAKDLLRIGFDTVTVDCIALNCWGKHKKKMTIRALT